MQCGELLFYDTLLGSLQQRRLAHPHPALNDHQGIGPRLGRLLCAGQLTEGLLTAQQGLSEGALPGGRASW